MNLQGWKPIVSKKGLYSFSVEATLQCPFCHVYLLITRYNSTEENIQNILSWIIDELNKKRACRGCGIISRLPLADFQKIEKEARKLITQEWLDTQIELLRAQNEKPMA